MTSILTCYTARRSLVTFHALLLGMLVCNVMGYGQTQAPRVESPIQPEFRKLEETVKKRLADDVLKRHSLDRKIGHFVVTNVPMYYVVYSLNALGIRVCYEAVAGDHEWYVDDAGVATFASDGHISMSLRDAQVRTILDQICAADPRYVWTEDSKRGLVVLAPKENSRLEFLVGPVKETGNPVEILQRLEPGLKVPLATLAVKGHNNLPEVQVDLPRCSARELLSEIASQQRGMTWGFGGRASFNYVRHPTADAVRIEFPALKKGQPVNSGWTYDVVERRVSGISTVMVEKRRTAKSPSAGSPTRASEGGDPPPAGPKSDVRTTEQNVVASRLVGSWKLEPTLTERLTGRAIALDDTLVVASDPEVKKKVPVKFMEEAMKEGFAIEVRMAGYIELRGAKFPFILTDIHGNPHLIYFRERGGDPFGDSESFNLSLVPARDPTNDLLFIGGDFNNQPFRAYARVAAAKKE